VCYKLLVISSMRYISAVANEVPIFSLHETLNQSQNTNNFTQHKNRTSFISNRVSRVLSERQFLFAAWID